MAKAKPEQEQTEDAAEERQAEQQDAEPQGEKSAQPVLDPATQRGVTPLPATAVNPSESYDDAAAGGPVDDGSDNDNDKG